MEEKQKVEGEGEGEKEGEGDMERGLDFIEKVCGVLEFLLLGNGFI